MLWSELVSERQKLSDREIVDTRHAYLWIYEAFGLLKLGRFDKVADAAKKGFEGICKGKGIFEAPHRNSLEYGLAAVLEAIASVKIERNSVKLEAVQKALRNYKAENLRYGRQGYPVIFDLQFSYPDLITPVLPGPDPEKD